MDPLTLLARQDKWFLGGGKGAIWAPPFPKHLHSFGYWDESYLADVRLSRLFTSLFLDAQGVPIRFTSRTLGWRPDRLELEHTASGALIKETRCVLECHAWVSAIELVEAPSDLEMFVWTLQDLRLPGYGAPWSTLVDAEVLDDSIAFRFDTAWPAELEPDRTAVEEERLGGASSMMLPSLPFYIRVGTDRSRISHTVNLAQRHDDSPLWETSLLPEKFSGVLPGDFKLFVGPGEPEGLVHMVQHYRLAPGERIQVFACAGLSSDSANRSFEFCRSTRCAEESERAWRRYFAGVPQFSSSDPWLTNAYWYRWYGLRLNTVDMPDLPIRAPDRASAFQAEDPVSDRGSAILAESGSAFQAENPVPDRGSAILAESASAFQAESLVSDRGSAILAESASAFQAESLVSDRGSAILAESASAFQAEDPVSDCGSAILIEDSGKHGQDGHDTLGLEGRATEDAPLTERRGAFLPHRRRQGGTYAVRFRLADAVPSQVRESWRAEREHLQRLEGNGQLTTAQRVERDHLLSAKIEAYLDSGQGSCVLRQPEIAMIVRDALKHFDQDRYLVHAWCIMPNHVHVLIEPEPLHDLEGILHSWKSFTANQINRKLGLTGKLWQWETYDHLVRDADDYENQRAYILNNPDAAGLKDWPWSGSIVCDSSAIAESAFGLAPIRRSTFQAEDPVSDRGSAILAESASAFQAENPVSDRGSAILAESGLAFQAENPVSDRGSAILAESGSAFQAEDSGTHGQDGHDTLGLEGRATVRTFSPFVTEGIGFFRNFVTYSAQAHLREAVWMHDPRLAAGILENLSKCQRADGSFPGHNYSCRPPRDFYHADFASGSKLLIALHPAAVSRNLFKALRKYAWYLLRERQITETLEPSVGKGAKWTFAVLDQNETGQEYMSRYQFATENADKWASFRLGGVDASAYAAMTISFVCAYFHCFDKRLPNRKSLWLDEEIGPYYGLWHCLNEEDHFYCDVLPDGTQSPARPATGLYALLAREERDGAQILRRWLYNEKEFWLAKGFPATAASDPTFDPAGEWKERRLNCPWSGRSWPMVNSHLVDVAASVARERWLTPEAEAQLLEDVKGDISSLEGWPEIRSDDQYEVEPVQEDLRSGAGAALIKAIKLMFHDGDPARPNSYEHYNPITGRPALYRGYDDYMHSWIVDLILRHAVGVQPGRDEVDPLPLGIEWIECSEIPHPRGRMHVRIERDQVVKCEITGGPAA